MSRTHKDRGGQRSKDLWSRRPHSYQESCKYWRKKCCKVERLRARAALIREINEPKGDG